MQALKETQKFRMASVVKVQNCVLKTESLCMCAFTLNPKQFLNQKAKPVNHAELSLAELRQVFLFLLSTSLHAADWL